MREGGPQDGYGNRSCGVGTCFHCWNPFQNTVYVFCSAAALLAAEASRGAAASAFGSISLASL